MQKMIEQEDLKIYYFHGFASGPGSTTAAALREAYPQLKVLSYDYTDYDKSLKQLTKQLAGKRFDHTDMFIGSSLGGYWANRFCTTYGVQTILINPCLNPNVELRKYDDKPIAFGPHKGSVYHHQEKYVNVKDRIYPRVVFIGDDDKVVDHTYTEKVLGGHTKIVHLPGEGHVIKDMEPIIKSIAEVANVFV